MNAWLPDPRMWLSFDSDLSWVNHTHNIRVTDFKRAHAQSALLRGSVTEITEFPLALHRIC